MHKGYAFVQFGNPFDARSACLGEDGRTVLGQVLGEFFFLFMNLIQSLRASLIDLYAPCAYEFASIVQYLSFYVYLFRILISFLQVEFLILNIFLLIIIGNSLNMLRIKYFGGMLARTAVSFLHSTFLQ